MPIYGPNDPDNEVDTAATVQDSDQDSGRTVLELRTAARFLNTSPDALRKRIKRGSAQGYKEGGRWLVVVDTLDRPTGQDRTERPDTSELADLYERLLVATEEATRYKALSEVSESTASAQIAELQMEKTALEERLAETARPWWRRLFGGGA